MTEADKTGILELNLTDFRSYSYLSMHFDSSFLPVILTGKNGAGKTNILEAVSFLSPGRGLRNARLSDVAHRAFTTDATIENVPINWGVSAKIKTVNGITQVGTGTTDTSDRRQIRIDGKNTSKQSDLSTIFRCLWLTPAQDRLFCGEPAARRRFLDRLVQAFDPQHTNRLSEYNTTFKEWAHLLKEGCRDNAWLEALEAQMVSSGIAISAFRLDVVQRLERYLNQSCLQSFPTAKIKLSGFLEELLLQKKAVEVEDIFTAYLKKSRKIFAEGGSFSGPHTADFSVEHSQRCADATLCSTGEQKALLVSILLAEVKALRAEQGICPLLLMDEAGAHFDSTRRAELFALLLTLPTQVWLTGTEESYFQPLLKKAQLFYIDQSQLTLKNVA